MNANNKPGLNNDPGVLASNNNDEIDLLDIIVQLWKGKWIIIVTMVVTMLLSIVYLSVAKEKWTSEAIVTQPSAGQVASYNATLSVLYAQNIQEKPSVTDLQNQLFGRFSASMNALAGALANQEEPETLKINQVNKGSNDALTISFVAQSAKKRRRS